MNAPLFDGNAWWAGLCVIGLGSLAGWVLPPWRGGRVGWVVRTTAGLVVIATLVPGAGDDGWLFRPGIWSPAGAVGLAIALYSLVKSCRSIRLPRVFGPGELIAGGGQLLVGLWLAMMLGPAFGPPVNYDVLEYHQGIIPHVFERGKFEPIPGVVYTRQPIATEALYTLAAAIEGNAWGRGPGILHWLLIVLGAAVFARLLKRIAIPAAWRPWIVLALLTHPLIFRLQLDRFTDWTGVTLLAAGLAALRSRGGWGAAALAGVIAGGAVSAKWTHAGTVALPLAIMLPVLSPARGRFVRLLAFVTAALVVWLPWVAWTWRYAHNPFSPFLASIFPTDFWPAGRLQFLMATHGRTSPLQAVYWTNVIRRIGWGVAGPPWIAVALVCGAAAAALKKKSRAGGVGWAGRLTLGLLLAVLLWGGLLHAAERFLAPSILLALVVMAALLRAFAPRRARAAAGPALAFVVLVTAAFIYRGDLGGLARLSAATVSGTLPADEYSRLFLGDTVDLFAAANRLPAGARLIAINEARRYPFRRPVALASVFDRSPASFAARGARDAGEIHRRLAAAGYTHILVNEFEQARILAMHTPPGLVGNRELQALIQRNDQAALVERFAGATEFSVEPLNPTELRAWQDFLDRMRAQAIWRIGTRPAMYISQL